MLTLILLFAMKVAVPSELACVGSVQDMTLPLDIYVAAVEGEGTVTFAVQGQLLHLNGPKVSTLKAGSVQRVVRPAGQVRDSMAGIEMGSYYRDIGTIKIENVFQDHATARVQLSCQGILKGDVVLPDVQKPPVEFSGKLSNDLTVIPEHGLASSILLGKDDAKEMAVGHICYIGLGSNDGVKPGDRFTVFRHHPAFNPNDMAMTRADAGATYSQSGLYYRSKVNALLSDRKLPPVILGDLIIVETGSKTSTAKVVNSLTEMHIGDLVVKR